MSHNDSFFSSSRSRVSGQRQQQQQQAVMDLLDLLSEPRGPRTGTGAATFWSADESMTHYTPDTLSAPVELMSQFLMLITEGRMSQALLMCDEILQYEPGNKMIRDYRMSLTRYIDQGLESGSDDETDDSDDEDGEEKGSKSESEQEDEDEEETGINEEHAPVAESKSARPSEAADDKLAYSFARVRLQIKD